MDAYHIREAAVANAEAIAAIHVQRWEASYRDILSLELSGLKGERSQLPRGMSGGADGALGPGRRMGSWRRSWRCRADQFRHRPGGLPALAKERRLWLR